MFAIPVFQRVDRLGLELRTISVHTKKGTTINGVAVDVTSCCQVKIQGWSTTAEETLSPGTSSKISGDLQMDYSAISLAAQHFIGKKDRDIEETIKQTVAGHQRAIIGVLTVEALYRDREQFSKRVLDLCFNDMRNMGLSIVSYTVAEITDDQGYIQALGVTQTESVKRDATEGRAVHENQGKARSAIEERNSCVEVNKQKEWMIKSDLDRDLKMYNANVEREKMKVIEKKAKQIEEAIQDEAVLTQRQKTLAAERKEEMLVIEEEVHIARLNQEKVTHVPADARLYAAKMERKRIEELAEAEANKTRTEGIGSADAQAAKIERQGRAKAEQEAYAVKKMGDAQAEAIRAKGMAEVEVKLAEAKAIKAKGMAEVEVLRERLKIWKEWYVFISPVLKNVARFGDELRKCANEMFCVFVSVVATRVLLWRRSSNNYRRSRAPLRHHFRRRRRWCSLGQMATVDHRSSQRI